MNVLSIRLPEDILEEADRHARKLQIPRAEYIRQAIERHNRHAQAEERRRRMARASERVRDESMRVLADFEALDDVPDA